MTVGVGQTVILEPQVNNACQKWEMVEVTDDLD